MRRIIQKYNEGSPGAVGPAVATGIPQGGHAAAAIQSYLSGQTAGPLSYTAGQSTVPDYRALAAIEKKRRLAEQAAGTTGASAVVDGNTEHSDMMSETADAIYYSEDSLGNSIPYTIVDTTDSRPSGYVDNTPEGYTEVRNYFDSSPLTEGGRAIGVNSDGTTVDFGFDIGPSVAGGRGTYVQSRPTSKLSDVFSPGATFAGGGTDNQGNFGIIGDIGGGLAEALGIVPEGYDWGANELDGLAGLGKAGVTQDAAATGKVGGVLSNLNLTGPVVIPTVTLDTSGGTQTANGLTFKNTYTGGYVDQNIGSGGKAQQRAEQAAQRIKNAEKAAGISLYGSEQAWLNATGGGNNMGGPIGPRVQSYNNGSAGGVAVAKSGLREDEIRQRQLMQARMPQVEASPLSDIGSKLAMGAIDKGIGSAASSMAAKEGLVGTLGNALGGSATTGLVTGAAGTGMMATLGPIGIGLGLGKLFGLFNDGGKVPCSCGKTSCKCAKEMKSPLSGE